MAWMDDVLTDDRWTAVLDDPERLEPARERLFEGYVSENPERKSYFDGLNRREQRAIRREFDDRLSERYGERYGPVEHPPTMRERAGQAGQAVRDAGRSYLDFVGQAATEAPAAVPSDVPTRPQPDSSEFRQAQWDREAARALADGRPVPERPKPQPDAEPDQRDQRPTPPPGVDLSQGGLVTPEMMQTPEERAYTDRVQWGDLPDEVKELERYSRPSSEWTAEERARFVKDQGQWLKDDTFAKTVIGGLSNSLVGQLANSVDHVLGGGDDMSFLQWAREARLTGADAAETATGRFLTETLPSLAVDAPIYVAAGVKMPIWALLPALDVATQAMDVHTQDTEYDPMSTVNAALLGAALRFMPRVTGRAGGPVRRVGQEMGDVAVRGAAATTATTGFEALRQLATDGEIQLKPEHVAESYLTTVAMYTIFRVPQLVKAGRAGQAESRLRGFGLKPEHAQELVNIAKYDGGTPAGVRSVLDTILKDKAYSKSFSEFIIRNAYSKAPVGGDPQTVRAARGVQADRATMEDLLNKTAARLVRNAKALESASVPDRAALPAASGQAPMMRTLTPPAPTGPTPGRTMVTPPPGGVPTVGERVPEGVQGLEGVEARFLVRGTTLYEVRDGQERKVETFKSDEEAMDALERALEGPAAGPERPAGVSVEQVDAAQGVERDDLLIAKGRQHFPGLRAQEHEEAGRLAYVIEKGEATLGDWEEYVARVRSENRVSDESAPVVPPARTDAMTERTSVRDLVRQKDEINDRIRAGAEVTPELKQEFRRLQDRLEKWDHNVVSSEEGRRARLKDDLRATEAAAEPAAGPAAGPKGPAVARYFGVFKDTDNKFAKKKPWVFQIYNEDGVVLSTEHYKTRKEADYNSDRSRRRLGVELRPIEDRLKTKQPAMSAEELRARALGVEAAAFEKMTGKERLAPAAGPTTAAEQPRAELPVAKPMDDVPERQQFESVTPQEDVRVRGRWRVMDVRDVVTSDMKGYDQALQPRFRQSKASQEQIEKIAQKPDPLRLSDSAVTDSGAPYIDEANQAISGNGRLIGLGRAYETERAGQYREYVLDRAQALGLSAKEIERPVLVREIMDTSGVPLGKVAELSNRSQILQRTDAELAEADARVLLDTDIMDMFIPDAVGNVRVASNREFNKAFVLATGDESLRTSDGSFSAALEQRVRRAVLSAILGQSQAGREVVRMAIEQPEAVGMKRHLDGLMIAGGGLMRLARNKPALDILPHVAEGYREFMQFKQALARNEVRNLSEHMAQKDMFLAPLSAEGELILHELARRDSIKAVRGFYDEYVRLAAHVDTSTESFFGESDQAATARQLLERARDEGQETITQTDLFGTDQGPPSQSVKPPSGPAGPGGGGRASYGDAPGAQGGLGGIGTPHDARVQDQTPRFMIETPEMIQLIRAISDGKVPKIVKQIRLGQGTARGVFRPGDPGDIELRADIFNLVQPADRQRLREEAEAYARGLVDAGRIKPGEAKKVADERYQQLYDDLREERLLVNREQAAKTIAHEVGHWVDFMPDHMLERGNLFGRIATLKGFLKHTMPRDPEAPHGPPITPKERAKLRREAQKQLSKELGPIKEMVRKIMVEEPEFRITGIKPADVRNLMGIDAREDNPELYRWFAEQSRQVKSEILKQAMRDLVDERLAAFGKKEQVGTRTVEKTVREKMGRAPTREEIANRYRELLRAEIKRRNLAEQKVVRDELMALSTWWRGDMGPKGLPHYKYRAKAEELYADAISVLINNPVELAGRAPTFYEMFFNYLGTKPEVKKVYEQIQDDIRSGNVQRDRVQRLRQNFARGNERGIQARELVAKTIPGELKDWFSFYFDRTLGPVYRRMEKMKDPVAQDRLLEAMEDFKYHEAQFELFLRQFMFGAMSPLERAGLDSMDLSEYVYHQRVINERADIANPDGWDPVHSQKRIDEMRGWGPDKFRGVEEGAAGLRKTWEDNVLQPLRESGAFDAEFMKKLDDNIYYATFAPQRPLVDAAGKAIREDTLEAALAQRFGDRISAGMHKQIGYLGDIRDPVSATLLKGRQLIQFAYRNKLARETVDMLRATDDPMFGPAKMRWVERGGRGYREPVKVETLRVGTLTYMEDGKLQSYYVPRVISEAFDRGESPASLVTRTVFTGTALVKSLFTSLNPGFWPWSLVWDSQGYVHHMPGARMLLGDRAYLKYAPRAAKAAFNLMAGKPDELADAALRNRDLIARGYYHGVRMIGTPTDGERLLISYGLKPPAYTEDTMHKIKSFVEHYMAKAAGPGQLQERIPKIAGRMYLDDHFATVPELVRDKRRRTQMGAGQKKETIHQLAGSPDYLSRGAAAQWMDVFFRLFFNPMKESLRSKGRTFKDRPVEAALKFALYTAPAAILTYMMENGMFFDELAELLGEDDAREIQKMFRAIPEREKTNHRVFPLGWYDKDDQKVIYLRAPFEPNERALHATLRAALTKGEGGQGIAQFYGDALPGDNPFLQVGSGWWDFAVRRKNPYDAFFRRNVLTDDQHDAGLAAGVGPMMKWTSNQFFGTLVGSFDLNPRSVAEPPPEGWEKFLNAPGVKGTLGRWVRISNRGLDDVALQTVQETRQHKAKMRLVGWEMVAREMAGEEYSRSQRRLLETEPFLNEWLYTKGRELGRLHLADPEVRAALNNARSLEERYQILQRLDELSR